MTLPCPWCDAPLRVTDATLARGTRCPACAVLVVVAQVHAARRVPVA